MLQNASPTTLPEKNQPLVSIVLPSYNGERYLAQAIASCLAQTHSNIELILVDDCSTDNTLSIMQEYAKKDSRITVLHNSINLHIAASLNIGFAQARGELFTWTSDDNFFDADAIQCMCNELASNKVDLVFAKIRCIDENGKKLSTSSQNLPIEYLHFRNIVLACFLFKKQVFTSLSGYDITKPYIEDYKFWLDALNAGFIFKSIDKTLYTYRCHSLSLTANKPAYVYEMRYNVVVDKNNKINLLSDRAKHDLCLDIFDLGLKLKLHGFLKSTIFILNFKPLSFFSVVYIYTFKVFKKGVLLLLSFLTSKYHLHKI